MILHRQYLIGWDRKYRNSFGFFRENDFVYDDSMATSISGWVSDYLYLSTLPYDLPKGECMDVDESDGENENGKWVTWWAMGLGVL